tara:strand:+ start:92 stop:334 length:243 start_codon:yes stop_codon:yes gene_type:complete
MDDDNKICQVYDFTSIKKSIDDKKNTYTEVSQEEWEHCVYIFFLFMCENGYDPDKQSDMLEFIEDFFPETSNDNEGNEDD